MAHTYVTELDATAKFLYLAFTTFLGSRTLGEEYTDLFYTTADGQGLPGWARRAGFVAMSAGTPLAMTRLGPRLKRWLQQCLGATSQPGGAKGWASWALENLPSVRTLLNVHLAVFYFTGAYYQLSKRLWGMRYSFGHREESQKGRVGYEVLGALLLAQISFMGLSRLKHLVWPSEEGSGDSPEDQLKSVLMDSTPTTAVGGVQSASTTDLTNPLTLAYIPEPSRSCVLCMSVMTEPAATVCGHLFCWTCICEWCREKVSKRRIKKDKSCCLKMLKC